MKQVLQNRKTGITEVAAGLMPTLEAARNKLDQPLPMGYCNVGAVAKVGAGVNGIAVGDRVTSNGKHVEAVAVPVQSCRPRLAAVGVKVSMPAEKAIQPPLLQGGPGAKNLRPPRSRGLLNLANPG